ncbi:hypothetical protein Daus18300_003190 [Diaporthe australafricana]|uniref:Uncharacterized protein n=1 Tax=Diaporthe australafricana TaxID=127596 RepID=A0ABR3XHK3_9PEZI
MRQHVFTKGDYDAVLLVYDVSDRRSFERVREFHAEISLGSGHSNKHHKRQRSHMPRRHSGPPTGDLQRRSSVMSFFSSGGGLVGVEEEVEFGQGSDGVVVALVGNKADVGDEDCDQPEKSKEDEEEQEQELQEQEDSFDDDCESALAVFGDALYRDLQEVEFGATSSVMGITSRPKPSRAESSETVERWLQVVGRAAEEEKEAEPHDAAVPKLTASNAKPRRSVSKAEGEHLARSLQLQVPFLETSARTGSNVEEAFEAVVRSVLKQMGRSNPPSTTELANKCRKRHEVEQQKHARASRSSKLVDQTTASAGPGRGQGKKGGLVLETKLDGGQKHTSHLERPASVQHALGRENITRRESFMGRMRRMLMYEDSQDEGSTGDSRGSPPVRFL